MPDDFWNQFLSKVNRYTQFPDIAANEQKLAPLVAAARAHWGDDRILRYLDFNPKKGAYTAMSYLTGNPYYDSGNDAAGNKYYHLFKVPGFDYGAMDDNWQYSVDDPSKYGYYYT